jgi:hypothetical protein
MPTIFKITQNKFFCCPLNNQLYLVNRMKISLNLLNSLKEVDTSCKIQYLLLPLGVYFMKVI